MSKRPVFLNLFQIRFPTTAIASISHRVSGVVLFLLIPMALWMLQESLNSENSYNALGDLLHSPLGKLMLAVLVVPFVYHLIAGVRHLIMDCGYGETKRAGKMSAYLVFIATIIVILALGGYLW